jgi:hypothetical protein
MTSGLLWYYLSFFVLRLVYGQGDVTLLLYRPRVQPETVGPGTRKVWQVVKHFVVAGQIFLVSAGNLVEKRGNQADAHQEHAGRFRRRYWIVILRNPGSRYRIVAV